MRLGSRKTRRGRRSVHALEVRASKRLLRDPRYLANSYLNHDDEYYLDFPDEDSFGESNESNSITSFSLQDFKILICNIRSIAGKVAELMQISKDKWIYCIFLQ